MKILIIGGTAFIGYHVVQELHQSGQHEVILFNRGTRKRDIPPGVRLIEGDRFQIDQHQAEFADLKPDVVLHMVPIGEEDTKWVMETFRGITSRIVAISSCDVYRAYGKLIGSETGAPESMPLTEDSPLRQTLYPYQHQENSPEILKKYDKILVEQLVMNDEHITGTILRLPVVYGERDYQHRMYHYLKRMADNRPAILINEHHANWRMSRAYVKDVAHAICLAITSDTASSRIYNVAETHALTEHEWIQRIAELVGWNGDIITLPDVILPVEKGFMPEQHMIIDSTRIRSELQYSEQTPPANAYQQTITWEQANPPANVDEEQWVARYEEEDHI
ncbi:MAG: NAD-dependent epimerase/dehydratase family protein, partial [Gemmatimonadetes bacterium]